MNLNLAQQALRWIAELGVKEVLVCAGARNAPLVYALEHADFLRAQYFFEERSAGFYGVGRILATRNPVAVITTSGTAVAELLPAVIEAHYQCLPLILVTADRPRSHRGHGTPQGIEQVGIFGNYVEACLDVEPGEQPDIQKYSARRPLHLNLCFDEPLLANEKILPQPWKVPAKTDLDFVSRKEESQLTSYKNPFVIVSDLPGESREMVHSLLKRKQWSVYLEAPSGLSGDGLNSWQSEVKIRERLKSGDHDVVFRVGSVPTTRLWRDLEKISLPVWSFSHRPFAGLASSQSFLRPLDDIKNLEGIPSNRTPSREGADFRGRLEELFRRYPRSEPAWMQKIFGALPEQAQVYIGNSLPIREWDLAWDRQKIVRTFTHRGANGIDGQISGFLGTCASEKKNFAVLGDLTSLYDMAGFWALRALTPAPHAQVIVVNNGGGQIFSRFFDKTEFLNEHDIRFEKLAEFWNWSYQKIDDLKDWDLATSPCVVEIIPDVEQTKSFWKDFGNLK